MNLREVNPAETEKKSWLSYGAGEAGHSPKKEMQKRRKKEGGQKIESTSAVF
jgi:hypothetical protein